MAESSFLGTVASLGALGVLVPAAWSTADGPGFLSLPWRSCVATLVHTVSLALVLTHLPLPRGLAPVLLGVLLWWLPALLGTGYGPLAALADFIDGPIAVAAQSRLQTQTVHPVDMAPTVAFGLAAWLLTPRYPRP